MHTRLTRILAYLCQHTHVHTSANIHTLPEGWAFPSIPSTSSNLHLLAYLPSDLSPFIHIVTPCKAELSLLSLLSYIPSNLSPFIHTFTPCKTELSLPSLLSLLSLLSYIPSNLYTIVSAQRSGDCGVTSRNLCPK